MDARDKYAYMTGDFENAYKILEDDKESYFFTDKMMEKAVKKLESAPSEDAQIYYQDKMLEYGPHTGRIFSDMYQISPFMGEQSFRFIVDQEEVGLPKKLMQSAQFMTDRRIMPSVKVGFARGLLEYMLDRYNER